MQTKTIAVLGLGWLGLPLAQQLKQAGYRVKGSVTSIEKAADLVRQGQETEVIRLSPYPEGHLDALLQADTLVVNIPPKAGKLGDDFHPEQIHHLINAIQQSPVQHIIYVSSTSVYLEQNRVMVETDVTTPETSPAPGLVRAENWIQSLSPDRATTILRCGGLMGYDRIPGKYIAGKTIDSGDVPVNYIHQDDAVAILHRFIETPQSGVFNVVAPLHPPRRAIYEKSCRDFSYALPDFVSPENPVPYKVISVEKLVQQMGYSFKYPDPLQFFYAQ